MNFSMNCNTNIKNITPDENCGYREIAALLGQGEESWSLIFQDLIQEIQT